MKGFRFVILALFLTHVAGQQCPSDKKPISVDNNCAQYYNCSTGSAVLATCPAGQYYNCINRNCGPDTWLPCCLTDPNPPTTDPNYLCTNEGFSVVNPFYCGLYFTCLNGEIQDGQCGYGQDFSSYNASCYDTTTGDCAPSTTSSPTTPTTPTTTTTTTTTTPTTATASTTTTSTVSTTAASGQAAMCPNNSLTYTNVDDCQKYYQCHNKRLVIKTCPLGSYWNCFKETCSFNGFSSCCPYASNKPPISINSCVRVGRKVANPADCTSYFECGSDLKITTKTCANGMKFDYSTSQCSNATNCVPVVRQPQTTTTTSASTTTCNSGDKVNNVFSCQSYYTCTNGQPVTRYCPFWKMNYNCWSNKCQWFRTKNCCAGWGIFEKDRCVAGSSVPDPASCTSYYTCDNNVSTKKYCSDGTVYDVWKKSCVAPTSGRCAMRPGETVCKAYSSGVLPFGAASFSVLINCP